MTRDTGHAKQRSAASPALNHSVRTRRLATALAVEPLEGRQLLSSFYNGLSPMRPIQSPSGMYLSSLDGPGLQRVQQLGGGRVAITLLGTTSASTLNIALTRPAPHRAAEPIQIAAIRVISGQLGGVSAAGTASLIGPMSPLSGDVQSLQFASLGANAQIDVSGSLASLGADSINLGPNGSVLVGGNLGQTLNVGGTFNIDGGRFEIGDDLSGSLQTGPISLTHGGRFIVGHDLTGVADVNGNMRVDSNGLFVIGEDLIGGLRVSRAVQLDTGGQVSIGNDVTGAISIGQNLAVSNGSRVTVGRDVRGGFDVGGSLGLAGGGRVIIGRDVNSLRVNGNLATSPSGGNLTVAGNLTDLTVNGAFVGKGRGNGGGVADLSVGLNLGALNVLGGGADQGGLQNANIDVAKNIQLLNIPHGIFNSFVTAGVLIDGGGGGGTGGNIGPDGPVAILNSEIRAGIEIDHLLINGDVKSTFATNPVNSTGYPTRIVAGLNRAGEYTSGGQVDNFQITGSLIDSVIAASVAPNGGDGTLPNVGYNFPPPTCDTSIPGDQGNNTYDSPGGQVAVGNVGAFVVVPNYTELNYYNMTLGIPPFGNPPVGLPAVSYREPNPDDCILPGSINASFSQARLSGSSLADPTSVLPLPTQSTVFGGVISTTHGDEADFAGLFAADTRGVYVGTLPTTASG